MKDRRLEALKIRRDAAEVAGDRPFPENLEYIRVRQPPAFKLFSWLKRLFLPRLFL
jgi:hypothetical protein